MVKKLALIAVFVVVPLVVLAQPVVPGCPRPGVTCASTTATTVNGTTGNFSFVDGGVGSFSGAITSRATSGGNFNCYAGNGEYCLFNPANWGLAGTGAAGFGVYAGGTQVATVDNGGFTFTQTANTAALHKISLLDAGQVYVANDLTVAGSLRQGTTAVTTCTLNGGSPSTCTATVKASSICKCSPVGTTAAIAAGGCAVSLSATTLTVTGPNAGNWVVNLECSLP